MSPSLATFTERHYSTRKAIVAASGTDPIDEICSAIPCDEAIIAIGANAREWSILTKDAFHIALHPSARANAKSKTVAMRQAF